MADRGPNGDWSLTRLVEKTMHSRRWWHWATLAAVVYCAGRISLGAGFALSSTSTDAEIKKYVDDSAKKIETLCLSSAPTAARDALQIRLDLLGQFDPARKLPSSVTFSYSKALNDAFRKMVGAGKPGNLALNAAVIVCSPQMDPLSNDQALGDALQNAGQPGVRYWAGKGLVASLPVLAVQLPNAVLGSKGLLKKVQDALKSEPSSVVVAELHQALAETAITTNGQVQTECVKLLTESMANGARKWHDAAPSPEQLYMATTSLDAVAKMVDPGKIPLAGPQKNDALSAACAYMSYAVQWAAKRSDPADALNPAIYRLVEAGRQAISKINGFGVPSIKVTEPVGTAELTINGAVGSSAAPADFAKNFPGVTQPTDIPESPAK
jgi:hypothetical protein